MLSKPISTLLALAVCLCGFTGNSHASESQSRSVKANIISTTTLPALTKTSLTNSSFISAEEIRNNAHKKDLLLRSHVGLLYDERDNELLFQRHADRVMPIASLTKLMTAMVVLDAKLALDEIITITKIIKLFFILTPYK